LINNPLFLRLRKSAIIIFLIQHGPAISALLIVACFILTRLPFFLHYRLVYFTADTWSYFSPLQQMRQGRFPDFWFRTPAYPLFVAFVLSVWRSALAIVIAQCIATIASSLATLVCFVRADRRLAYPAGFALVGFVGSAYSVDFDTTLMSESLYCSLLNLSIGMLTLAILRGGRLAFAGASFAMAGSMLTRPAGFFLFGVYALVLAWLLLRRQPRRQVLAFLLPVPMIFLALCTYNRAVVGSFTVTPLTGHALLGAAATFIEEDPGVDAAANAMARAMRDSVTPEDRATVFTSRDVEQLYPVFIRYHGPAIYIHAVKLKCDYAQCGAVWGHIARASIAQHPQLYLKFVAVNYYKYYQISFIYPDFYHQLRYRYDYLYLRRDIAVTTTLSESDRRDLLMEYWSPVSQSHIQRMGEQIVVDTTWSRRMHERFDQIYSAIFSNVVWLFAAVLLFPAAIWKFARTRDAGAFLVLTCLLAFAAAGLAVGITVFAIHRYTVTSLFLCHLTPVYLCLLTRR
jgi:hypothetical protein